MAVERLRAQRSFVTRTFTSKDRQGFGPILLSPAKILGHIPHVRDGPDSIA
jgi:hypothetical protein